LVSETSDRADLQYEKFIAVDCPFHINGSLILPLDVQKQCHEGLQWILGKTV